MADSNEEKIPDLIKQVGDRIYDYEFTAHVAGSTFQKNGQKILSFLKRNVPISQIYVQMVPEPTNPYDENAVQIYVSTESSSKYFKVGYMPKSGSDVVAYVLNHKEMYNLILTSLWFSGETEEKPSVGMFFKFKIERKGEKVA